MAVDVGTSRAADSRTGGHRLIEIATGLCTYLVLTSLLWGGLVAPLGLAVVVLLYDCCWLYRSWSAGIMAIIAYRRMRRWQATDWLARAEALPGFEALHHLVIVPTYCEPVEVLRATLSALAEQDFPTERLAVMLGFEGRDRHGVDNARLLEQEFEGRFGYLWATFHPHIDGEVAGKSSNQAWAARIAKRRLIDEAGVDIDCTTVTSCDADSRLSPRYFSALSCLFLTKPAQRIYQPIILFHSNVWRLPIPTRVLNSVHSYWQLAKLVRTDKLVPQSTYSMSFATCVGAGYWDVDVIPEDSHMFFKLLFHFGSEVRVEPIYLPVMADAAEASGFLATLRSQFNQEMRWAWGVSDIPYVLLGSSRTRSPGVGRQRYRALRYIEEHLTWPVGSFLLTFGGGAALHNHAFAATHFGLVFPIVTGWIFSSSFGSMVILVVIDWILRSHTAAKRSGWERVLRLAEWIALPTAGLVLSALPALVAHSRLLAGRYLQYRATPKLAPPSNAAVHSRLEPLLSPVAVAEQ